jgi:hypothetical protein
MWSAILPRAIPGRRRHDFDDRQDRRLLYVTIRRNGPNFLGPHVDTPFDGKFSGRMWNLLQPERPIEKF